MRNDLILAPWAISHRGAAWNDAFLESVFFSGNGRMGVRGYLPFEPTPRPVDRGIFVAGIFGEVKPGITDFVNLPTPVWEQLRIDGKKPDTLLAVEREFDLYKALFKLTYTVSADGKAADICYTRFFPYDRPSLCIQRTVITPRGQMEIRLSSGIQTSCCNSPIPDDQTKDNLEELQLAQPDHIESREDGLAAEFRIAGTGLTVRQTVCFSQRGTPVRDDNGFGLCFTSTDGPYCLDKLTCVETSRDVDPRLEPIPEDWSWEELLIAHEKAWAARWDSCDMPLQEPELQTALRYCMYQLIAGCSRKDPTVSIGARGLTHARYKGCYFWDTDLFMFPFYLETDPEAARNLCEYRIGALPAAKKHSAAMNTAGARYPWMASLDGSEQCETWDIGCSELHITADVVYAIDRWCETSQDRNFYLDRAAAVYIETARFWRSRYTFDPNKKKADLLWCKGPDEYCGVTKNNLYTNVMVQHNLLLACRAAEDLKRERPALYQKLQLSGEETAQWQALRSCIPWPRDPDTGRLTTDDTFHLMEPVELSALKPDETASYHRVCFDRLQRYKVVKQADVLLLMTRFPNLFTAEEKLDAWRDFEPICLHDSTLSFASHALFALQNGLTEQGSAYLRKALLLDLRDIMGNTGKEGLHLACMGEAWQAAHYMK